MKQNILEKLFYIAIIISCMSSLIACSPVNTAESATQPEQPLGVESQTTSTPEPTIQISLSGQVNFELAHPPIYGQVLFLPASEIMHLLDLYNISISPQMVTCNYYDKDGKFKNAFYNVGSSPYSVDTDSGVMQQAGAIPFYQDGEVYVSEAALEAMTGDIFSYDPQTGILNIDYGAFPVLQAGNPAPYHTIQMKKPSELNDNRITNLVSGFMMEGFTAEQLYWVADNSLGWKWQSATINNQDWLEDDFSVPDFNMTDAYAAFYKKLDDNGMYITYNLIFKDKEFQGEANREGNGSLHDPAQVKRYLEYVRQVVTYFKGVVDEYEIWNEPNIGNSPQYVAPDDYIAVVKQAYPLIKSIDPNAKVSIGHTTSYYEPYSQDYIDALVSSDVVLYADQINLHSFFFVSPEYYSEYYYAYPELIESMKAKAVKNGFKGDFWGSEGNYTVYETVPQGQEYMIHSYTEMQAAKYVQRVNAMNIGLGLSGGAMGVNNNPTAINAVGRSAVLFSGVKPANHGIQVKTEQEPLRSFSYDVDLGKLYAYWYDGIATDQMQSWPATITLDLPTASSIHAYDVITGIYQPLKFNTSDGQIVIDGISITDYPIFLVVEE